jgi:hypothetical protein
MVDTHRAGNVFEGLLAHVVEGKIELVADLIAHNSTETNPAGFGDPFQSGCYVHPVAVDVVAVDDDVAEIDTDAEYNPPILGSTGIALDHPTLHCHSAGDGLNHTREFDQDSVAGRLDDATFVFGSLRVDQFTTMASEPCESAGLVLSHEAAVSGHIGGENGREPALDALPAHNASCSVATHRNSSRHAID